VIEQHTFEMVLRNVCRPAGADQCALLDGRVPDLDPGPFPGRAQRGAERHQPFDVVAAVLDPFLQSPAPEQFHGVQAEHRRPGQRRRCPSAVDEKASDPHPREGDRRDQTGGPAADHDDPSSTVAILIEHHVVQNTDCSLKDNTSDES